MEAEHRDGPGPGQVWGQAVRRVRGVLPFTPPRRAGPMNERVDMPKIPPKKKPKVKLDARKRRKGKNGPKPPNQAPPTDNMTEGISANFAEKPGRGRPAIYTFEFRQVLANIYPNLRSKRGLEEAWMVTLAVGAIQEQEPNWQSMRWVTFYIPGDGFILHRTILAALGRIADKRLLLRGARAIAREELRTDTALAFIGRIRHRVKKQQLRLLSRLMDGR